MPTYSGKTKIKLCQRLGKSWKALADYFEIPAHERDDFGKGEECSEIWEWLNERNKLPELEKALEFIDREDLVTDILETIAPPTPPQQPWQKKPPYPGLRPFAPDEAPIFFGRSLETQELLARLTNSANRFIAVVGASGSGKSSLVAAGVIPRLHEIPGGKDWLWVRFTPGRLGNDPFLALAGKLEPLLEKRGLSGNDIANKLRSTGDLSELAGFMLEDKDAAELLLFIDQFEELFTLTAPEYQHRFSAMLAKAVEVPRLRILLTLRADFFHRCLEQPRLAELLNRGFYSLAAPGLRALLEMITGPAALAGLKFEAGLPEHILEETGREPGALALMAFALAELYKAREPEGTLTRAAYERFGGVKGAIRKRADETFDDLDAEAKKAFGNVFKELVEVDPERGVPTRKHSPLQHFRGSSAALKLIDEFTKARLLVCSRAEASVEVVEVAHEALLSNWPRLAEWIEERFDDFRLFRYVKLEAAEWQRLGRPSTHLWRHERLAPVYAMQKRLQPKLSEVEAEFTRPESEHLLEEIDNPATSHQRRAIIGDRLAEIGDPRRGVVNKGGLPDFVWCPVPAGEITLENDAGIFCVEPFYISKYPVTWAQYRRFLEATDGYRNKKWWNGLAGRLDEPGKQYRQLDNHPAENVSWYDAVAFCRWLSVHLGYEIRLPTEWEWQQAATGGNRANEFPWGAHWSSEYANTYEGGLSRTTAVGMYPRGTSPVGALDMSGNVWEWCLNEYENPKRIDLSGDARRVVRGGSWDFDLDLARAAFRNYSFPFYRFYDLGVRVVCSSPIFS